MPKMLVMPSEQQLPEGPRREFVAELFAHYRDAKRPTLRQIEKWIRDNADDRNLAGTASTETIRRVLTGAVVPRNWLTVEVILVALCGIAGRNADEERWDDDTGGYGYNREPGPTFKESLIHRWNAALDQSAEEEGLRRLPPKPTPQQPASQGRVEEDPWATGPSRFGGSVEDPPF